MKKPLLYGLLLFVMVVWGFNVIAVKIIVESFSPVTITSLRVFLAGLVVLAVLFYRKELKRVTKQEATYILIGAFSGVLGHHLFLAVGLTTTTASNAALILGLIPLVTSIFAVLFLKARFTITKLLGVILGFTGVSFIVMNGAGVHYISIGDFYIFLSVIAQAISFIFIKKATQTLEAKVMTCYMLILGATFLFITSLLMDPSGITSLSEGTSAAWLIFLASAVIATGIGHMIYNSAIHQLGAGETAIFINLTPFFALVGSVLFLGESITSFQLLGFIFIISGVLLGSGIFDHKFVRNSSIPLAKS
ncbi:DMT family transporter [Bacillus luteolus]|uniref:DMT family transporter n=1 Tax=Litchfieldia luteola TaxID=682179 RepID=A0ABR9QKH5_9BACI|nr:DMT family transporter [Cytobacillus luteolus]